MVELTAEQIEGMLAMYEETQGSLTAEQKAQNVELGKAVYNDPAKLQEAYTELQETFKAADTNGNGKLTLPEFLDNMKKREANAKAKGYHVAEVTDEVSTNWYNKMVECAGADADGLTFEQMESMHKQVGAAWMAKNQ